jgi:hypothetical protein
MRCHMKCLTKKLKLPVIVELVLASIRQIISPVAASFRHGNDRMITGQSDNGIAVGSAAFGRGSREVSILAGAIKCQN